MITRQELTSCYTNLKEKFPFPIQCGFVNTKSFYLLIKVNYFF